MEYMEYTAKGLSKWGEKVGKWPGKILIKFAAAWAQEVAELEKQIDKYKQLTKIFRDDVSELGRDKEELRELCRLKSDLENQSGSMAYECVPFGRRTELDNRISELWEKHIGENRMDACEPNKGGEG